MNDEDRYKLLYGPYKTPNLKTGELVYCERFGWVMVDGWSEGPIVWPLTRRKAYPNILHIVCGDLIKAVTRESNQAVAYWWGVHINSVSRWRKTLGVSRYTEGTSRLNCEYCIERFTEEKREVAYAMRKDPKFQAERYLTGLERGYHRQDRMPWPEEHIRLLGTMPDAKVAIIIGRKHDAVSQYRRKLGIASFLSSTQHATQRALREKTRCPLSADKLRARRISIGLLQCDVAERLGLNPKNYVHYENQPIRYVTNEFMKRLAVALECELVDLL